MNLDAHPDLRKGGRPLAVHDRVYIATKDLDAIESSTPKKKLLYRLMHCLNLVRKKDGFHFDSLEQEQYARQGNGIFHWLPVSDELIHVKLVMEDGSARIGLAEPSLQTKKIGDIVQFERVCFARYDHDEDSVKVFWYLHR